MLKRPIQEELAGTADPPETNVHSAVEWTDQTWRARLHMSEPGRIKTGRAFDPVLREDARRIEININPDLQPNIPPQWRAIGEVTLTEEDEV